MVRTVYDVLAVDPPETKFAWYAAEDSMRSRQSNNLNTQFSCKHAWNLSKKPKNRYLKELMKRLLEKNRKLANRHAHRLIT